MEDSVIIIISLALMACTLIGIKMFRGETQVKRVKKEVQESANKEVISSKDMTITTLKDELRSVKGKLYKTLALEAEEEEEEEPDNQVKPVTWEEITALVNSTYPKYAKLLPLVKKQVMDATKGLSMEEILNYVKQFTGGQQPQATTGPTAAEPYNPNWA